MSKYAKIKDSLAVEKWLDIDDPSVIPTHKTWSDGGKYIRPVVENAAPAYRPELARLKTDIVVEPDRVVITHTVEPYPIEMQRLAVKDEARRRILETLPDWKQANMTARGVELQDIWRINGAWTAQEQAEADALKAAWAWIKAIRAKSNEVEALDPIPDDFDADARWQV